MKKILLISLLMSFQSFAGIAIISDLDDTIKITHVASPAQAVARGVFRRSVFTGMPEFLQEARAYAPKLHVLTASPKIIKRPVLSVLYRHGIQFESLAFKNPFLREGKIEYKVKKIREILENSNDQFILLGDDVDKDPEIFEEVVKLFPDRILVTYVHLVRGRKIPAGSIAYWTAADLALRELTAGRMSSEASERILDTLNAEGNLNHVIPYFANCPENVSVWSWQKKTVLAEKSSTLIRKLGAYCGSIVESDDL